MDTANNNHHARQFIYTCPEKVLLDNSLTLNEIRIYMIIRSFMDNTGYAFPTNKWLAEKLGITERRVRSNITLLVEKGYLQRVVHKRKRFLVIPVAKIPDNPEPERVDVDDTGGDANVPGGEDADVPILYKDNNKNYYYHNNSLVRRKKNVQSRDAENFEEFWNAYPLKKGKKACLQKWKNKKLDSQAGIILLKLREQIENDRHWLDGYIPNPLTYLNQERWTDDITPVIQSLGSRVENKTRELTLEDVMRA